MYRRIQPAEMSPEWLVEGNWGRRTCDPICGPMWKELLPHAGPAALAAQGPALGFELHEVRQYAFARHGR